MSVTGLLRLTHYALTAASKAQRQQADSDQSQAVRLRHARWAATPPRNPGNGHANRCRIAESCGIQVVEHDGKVTAITEVYQTGLVPDQRPFAVDTEKCPETTLSGRDRQDSRRVKCQRCNNGGIGAAKPVNSQVEKIDIQRVANVQTSGASGPVQTIGACGEGPICPARRPPCAILVRKRYVNS